MADLKTTYMGIALKNPIIAGASPLTARLDTIKRLEDAGAAAIVTASLFEEQIQLERHQFEEAQTRYENVSAEMVSTFPRGEHAGPEEHLMWVRKAKEAVKIPVIGSLNAVEPESWKSYAKLMTATGVDGLELNFYSRPTEFDKSGADIERDQLAVLASIVKSVTIPVSVKLSVHYTNPLAFIKQLDARGVKGFVLFNRFFQPDIDLEKQEHVNRLVLSDPDDARLPLRYSGLLYGNVGADVCASTGIYDGDGVARMLLAGASCVQVASAVIKNKAEHVSSMLQGLEGWMQKKGYASVSQLRGKLSRKNSKDPWAYLRGQYVRIVMSRPAKG
jgi:dihydroorotate dehydrogenase (fumarate)